MGDAPNQQVRDVYDQLGELLGDGDDAFVEEGPAILAEAIEEPGFFDGIEAEPADDSYTRAKVIGDPGEHVIRYMEWPPEYALMPHEHHGRPCFEVLVDGMLFLADMDAREVDDGLYDLEVTGREVCEPGDTAVVDPRNGSDIHAVYSPVRTRSLHVYPDDAYYSVGYVDAETDDPRDDLYHRKEFQLKEEE